MKVLFYLGHPAHYHLLKHPIRSLKEHGHKVQVVIKSKDILEELLQRDGMDYVNILPEGRKDHKLGIIWGVLKRDWRLWQLIRNDRPDMMLGTEASIVHVGRMMGIPAIIAQEDDAAAIPGFVKVAYPFATFILAPTPCDVGGYENKKLAYEGYHELAYLHPNNFSPKVDVIKDQIDCSKPFYILRFAKLTAHHDKGRSGITTEVAAKIIDLLKDRGTVYITSERELEPEFEPYRIAIDPLHIHHALALADMYIGDSQTMAAEAAVLGTPSLRFNDFVGELSYLEELEHSFHLTKGVRTNDPEKLFETIRLWLQMDDLKSEWAARKDAMLRKKIDLAAFMVWLIEDYPKSVLQMRSDDNLMGRFTLS